MSLPRNAWWCKRDGGFLYWQNPDKTRRTHARDCPDCVLVLITESIYSDVIKTG